MVDYMLRSSKSNALVLIHIYIFALGLAVQIVSRHLVFLILATAPQPLDNCYQKR